MRFLFMTFGSAGDVFPMLGLALVLQKRGHDVTLATNEHFRELTEQHGVSFRELGTKDDYDACLRNPELWKPNRAFVHVFRSLVPILKTQYQLIESMKNDGRLVTVSNCLAFGARIAQDKLKIPNVTLHLQPSVIWSRIAPPELPNVFGPRWLRNLLFQLGCRFVVHPVALPFLNQWRNELSLPPISNLTHWWHSPWLSVCLFPEWFAPRQSDWPANTVHTDFPLWNEGSGKPLPFAVSEFLSQGDRPIAFAAGTGNVHGHAFFAAAVEGCQLLGKRAILLTRHRTQIPESLPSSVHFCEWAPLDDLLPHCSAFVHHGGIGSMSQAFAAGIPQLIMPLAHDQFDNAARVKRFGCGDSLLPSAFRPTRLASALNAVLESERRTGAAAAVANRLRDHSGLDLAASVIEQKVNNSGDL